jgi:hypothetical protein
MTSRKVFEKKTGDEAYSEVWGSFDPEYTKMLEEQRELMLEVLKEYCKTERCEDCGVSNCGIINCAVIKFEDIINQVSGEQI